MIFRTFIEMVISKPQPQLLGRWRCVGTQKNGKDILEIKMTNKKNRHERYLLIEKKLAFNNHDFVKN